MKNNITVRTIFFTSIIFQISITHVELYNFKCPVQGSWKLRAKAICNSISKYFCLFNNAEQKYVEGCKGPDYDRRGSKRIFSGFFTRGPCNKRRYQPFTFWTNGSISDCIYDKSLCNEEGQIVHNEESTKDDRTCQCDYTRNFTFVKAPRNLLYCIPTEEDCSCYIKLCPVNFKLSSDYDCVQSANQDNQKSINTHKHNESLDGKPQLQLDKDLIWIEKSASKMKLGLQYRSRAVLYCVCLILIIGGCFIVVLNYEQLSEKIQQLKQYLHRNRTGQTISATPREWFTEKLLFLKRYFRRSIKNIASDTNEEGSNAEDIESLNIVDENHTLQGTYDCSPVYSEKNTSYTMAIEEKVDVEVHQPLVHAKLTTEEENFLRMIHLLYRVALPVVRMIFNHEIQPDQLRKTLYENRDKMKKMFRLKEFVINNYQWDLLFKGKAVTSKDFDIRLMVYLLHILANYKIEYLYPVQSDKSMDAMLSLIKFVRNDTTRTFDGKLSRDQFNKYWNDVGQAILTLSSSRLPDIGKDQEGIQLIGRLLVLNPIQINNVKLCRFIEMSEIKSALILLKIISEYCESCNMKLEDVLREKIHELYHKRIKTFSCCKCSIPCPSYNKVITEKHWNALYEVNECSDSHVCPLNLRNCSERFVQKTIITCDLSVAKVLILSLPNLFFDMMSRLYTTGFDILLMNYQHSLYHLTRKERCCKCVGNRTKIKKKLVIKHCEWDTLFLKNGTFCQISSNDCCCQFSVKKGIKYSDIDETLLYKIFQVAGPIGVLNEIEYDAFSYFLNLRDDDNSLQKALLELLYTIKDKNFCRSLSSCIPPQSDGTTAFQMEATRRWMSNHIPKQREGTGQIVEILLHDLDGWNVRRIQIPQDSMMLKGNKEIGDLTNDENNFLVTVYGLSKIVYPIIKEEFEKHCPRKVLNDILNGKFDIGTYKDEKESQRENIYLTQEQRTQLEKTDKLPLKLMIYILKKTKVEMTDEYVKQLNEIINIAREIVQSSNGMLENSQFQDIKNRMSMAVQYLSGNKYTAELSNLDQIKVF